MWSEVGEGLNTSEIRISNNMGIAGAVFTSGQTINISHAYADMRFNPSIDKKTGFFTRSILCVPVVNKTGEVIGVTQVLNKQGGPFTAEDESRLRAFTSQISIGLENARLFNDVQNMKNYNESMLESMSNGVITINEEGKIVTCNSAGFNIMGVASSQVIGHKIEKFFCEANTWILEKIKRVEETQESEIFMDAEMIFAEETLSVNLTILPLISTEKKALGTMIMMEDISTEKRMKSTMSRYMDPGIAEQLLKGGEDILGGITTTATILFSDIRGFTTLSEELGPQGTVGLLNEYFTLMVECISKEGGMLDKFIGDAIMAAFGIPVAHDDDEDRALRAAIGMVNAMLAWDKERLAKGQMAIDMHSTTATILFSDIRGFTTLSEELGPQGTVGLLNEYFTLMVECISKEGGMLDKFIGDAIMAAFGIPVAHDDDEDRALRAAIGMVNAMLAWDKERLAKGQMAIDMGLGLNTDNIVSGNIGSQKRMDYTMIGDGVNLAARLESACKQYSARIIISANTFNKLRGTYRIRYIDDVVVKGKTEPVGIHEVLDFHTDDTFPNLLEVVNYFNEGRKKYRSGNWDQAIKNFQQALKLNPQDHLSKTYIERCEVLKKDAPPDWDGVWKMTSK